MSLLGYILGAQGQLEITNSIADLGRVAREFKDQGISTLAINGGDGTICRTLTAFINEYGSTPLPQVALLRGGTINMLAANLGIKGSPEQVLYRLVEWHASGEPFPTRRLRSLQVEGTYGFLFGNGVAASFLKEYYKRKSGPLGAFLWCIGVWGSRFFGGALFDRVVQDRHMTLVADGGPPISHTTCAVFCATVPKLPLGYPLFASLKGHPDQFQCVSFTFAARDAVWQLPVTLLKRQDGSTKGKMSLRCRELVIEGDAPFDYTLDGELYVSRSRRLYIGTGPDLEFVTI
jgi:hypothetical protein